MSKALLPGPLSFPAGRWPSSAVMTATQVAAAGFLGLDGLGGRHRWPDEAARAV